jgi:hypothetical protein
MSSLRHALLFAEFALALSLHGMAYSCSDHHHQRPARRNWCFQKLMNFQQRRTATLHRARVGDVIVLNILSAHINMVIVRLRISTSRNHAPQQAQALGQDKSIIINDGD